MISTSQHKAIWATVLMTVVALAPACSSALDVPETRRLAQEAFDQEDHVTALKLWAKASNRGDAESEYRLGLLHERGRGTEKDPSTALKWFKRAAEQGHAGAQYRMGSAYALGEAVEEDQAKAAQWFLRAAENGDPDAQLNIGSRYARGAGVELDHGRAVYWLARANAHGGLFGMVWVQIPPVLENLTPHRAKTDAAPLRAKRSNDAETVRQVREGEVIYLIEPPSEGWVGVYLSADHALGYLPIDAVISETEFERAISLRYPGWPSRPQARQGVVSCNTQCVNADCKRTYDDGRRVRFEARRTYDAFTGQWGWDSGSC